MAYRMTVNGMGAASVGPVTGGAVAQNPLIGSSFFENTNLPMLAYAGGGALLLFGKGPIKLLGAGVVALLLLGGLVRI